MICLIVVCVVLLQTHVNRVKKETETWLPLELISYCIFDFSRNHNNGDSDLDLILHKQALGSTQGKMYRSS